MKRKLYWTPTDFRNSVKLPEQISGLKGQGHWGSVNPERMGCAIMVMKLINAKNYMEIGVNIGHSLHYILQSVPTIKRVLAFDLCDQDTHKAWEILSDLYINGSNNIKMDLVCGNTLETLKKNNSGEVFDVIHIDGGHSFEVCYSDIVKSRKFAHKNTIIIIDDAGAQNEQNSHVALSVNKAIEKAVDEGIVGYINPGVCSYGSVFMRYLV